VHRREEDNTAIIVSVGGDGRQGPFKSIS
jgi:hypothetical protein